MNSFFKDNIALIAGISLPLILTLVFFLSTQIGEISEDPPQYKLVFATHYHSYNTSHIYRLSVEDQRLRYKYFPPDEDQDYLVHSAPQLYVYDPALDETREIELPDIPNPREEMDVIVEELAEARMSKSAESPDGYVFEYEYRGGGNLMTELFGGGYRNRSHYTLRKGSHRIRVPQAYRYDSHFVGWIIEEG